MGGWVDKLNDTVAHSKVGRYFQLDHSGHRRERKGTKFCTELRAGLTIFFAMVTNVIFICDSFDLTHIIHCRPILFPLTLQLSLRVVVLVSVMALLLILLVTMTPIICNVFMKLNLT
jgi:xanthine/uracil/vitamin C permease (AzgA family)